MDDGKAKLHLVVGLGVTGLSCVRYLVQQQIPVAVIDTRTNPPNLADLQRDFPNVPYALGQWDPVLLDQANTLIVSPGLSLKEPAIAAQIAKGKEVIGDIELFVRAAGVPIIAITGTNAKSTVTTLVGKMAETAGVAVQVGGNLGVPALELLTTPRPALFVLELSSFQLETTYSLRAKVATILNVTPDHMDRYDSVEDYRLAKQRIYLNSEKAVCNRDDAATFCPKSIKRKYYFTLDAPQSADEFGLIKQRQEVFLAQGKEILLGVRELPVLGRHYQANALAALALGFAAGLPMAAMLATLREFKGLPHRCQLVREHLGVRWYNDSKGTNVGATLAAINGLGCEITGKLVLIAGGVGKNADFSSLIPVLEKYVRSVILIGEAATVMTTLFSGHVEVVQAETMEAAVISAASIAEPADSVLLSPACASFDMFKHFAHRGDVFTALVQQLQ